MLSCEGKLRNPPTFKFPNVQASPLQLLCICGTLQDYTGISKLKEQLVYLKHVALTAGWVAWFEAFPVLTPLHPHILMLPRLAAK